jgi:NADH-quinone oxidoreductase subunit C
MSTRAEQLQAALEGSLGSALHSCRRALGEVTVTVGAADYLAAMQRLRDDPQLHFEQLIDLCSVDYSEYKNQPWAGPRFCVVVHLLSIRHNWRLRVKVFPADDDLPSVPTVTDLWAAANWFEREAFDLYGIVFEGHNDLRRILTDYGFIGHPMR